MQILPRQHYPPPCRTDHLYQPTMKYHIFLGFLAAVAAYPGIIHDEAPQLEEKYDHALIGESGHHHAIQHEHAKSHQSIKFEHFHPVPVYVKKEHHHLLEHPLEKGKSEQDLKLIHPETEHKHGGGLVLEDHRLNTDHLALEHHGGLEHGGFEHGGFEHLGGFEGFEGGEGLKAYAEVQPSHGYAEHGQALSGGYSGESYGGHYGGY
ncbi:cation channel sperm-associated protein 1 [Amyelois transitella]|uniref:cation channel sperm-associated protein 1 n=1 Tax=Amyelois transitella TaxID=680683 RepID=UPI0029907F15|nr:cation channel sperm-associated protein 1 [Amyelois transitella]